MMQSQISQANNVHRNIPQLLFQTVMAAVSVCIWGRATGKTEGPMVDFTVNNIFSMPRANGFLMGTTYQQLLSRTLPPLIAGWEKYGLFENQHFWIKKYAPDKLRRPKAWRHPIEPEHYIHVYNGSGIYLVSQDRPGTINGIRSQYGAGDEARLLNKPKFDEDVLPTMTGHADMFGHLPNYLSLLFCSDMPRSSKGKWLLDYRSKMDKETIEMILVIQSKVVELQTMFFDASESTKKKLRPKLHKLYDYLNQLRKGTVYFSTATTLDNIHVLGVDSIKHFKRELSELDFQISILNREMIKLENGFYALLDEDYHGYDDFDYSVIDSLVWDYKRPQSQSCKWDGDIDKSQPLDIACDHNNAINSIVTGQEIGNEYRMLSSKYVLNPDLLKDMVEKWHNYYKYHPVKEVNYFYDSTSVGGDASTDISFSDEVFDELKKRKWDVTLMDIGQIGSHHSRHFFWGKLLQERDPRLPKFRFNKSNCSSWLLSSQQADVYISGEKIKKDKRPEQREKIPPQEATHLSEAGDILIWGRLRERIGEESSFVDNVYA